MMRIVIEIKGERHALVMKWKEYGTACPACSLRDKCSVNRKGSALGRYIHNVCNGTFLYSGFRKIRKKEQ